MPEAPADRPQNDDLANRLFEVEKKIDLLWRDDPRCKDISTKLVYCKKDLNARKDLATMLTVNPKSQHSAKNISTLFEGFNTEDCVLKPL